MSERTARAARQPTRKKANGSSNGAIKADAPPGIRALPDVAGQQGRLEVLADLLYQSQKQRFRYEAIMVANGHDWDDPVAGMPVTDGGGEVNSYRRLSGTCSDQEEALLAKWPELREKVEELVRRRQAEEG